ncbi:MAG: penicillin-binding transpeptidase domain-containing protein, partial [Cyanophyceae cyanobacterium]
MFVAELKQAGGQGRSLSTGNGDHAASFGHGIAVSPLAFTAAFNTIANDGEYVAPNLILEARNSRPPRRRVMAA